MAARFCCGHRGGNPGRLKWGPVEEDTTGEGAGDVQVLNCGVVPLGDQSRQESRVGDTGDNSARHLAPVELRGVASTIGTCMNKQGTR